MSEQIYNQLAQDLKAGDRQWREISEQYANWMLCCLPPIRHSSGYCFMNSEPYSHTAEGRGIFFTCLEHNGKFWAILATVKEWDSRVLKVGTNPPSLNL